MNLPVLPSQPALGAVYDVSIMTQRHGVAMPFVGRQRSYRNRTSASQPDLLSVALHHVRTKLFHAR